MRKLLAIIMAFVLLSPGTVQANSPACNLQTQVIHYPGFTPDWIIATLTGLDPTKTYVITLVAPDASVQQTDSDYGQTYNQQAFAIPGQFQSGFYYGILQLSGSNTVLASCRVAP